jgi:hypothetical protein
LAGGVCGQEVTVGVLEPDPAHVLHGAQVQPMTERAVCTHGLIIADMTGTAFCDPTGVRMLLTAHDHARASGSALRIVGIYASIEDAMPVQPCAHQPTA